MTHRLWQVFWLAPPVAGLPTPDFGVSVAVTYAGNGLFLEITVLYNLLFQRNLQLRVQPPICTGFPFRAKILLSLATKTSSKV